jgi:hypothetical protein
MQQLRSTNVNVNTFYLWKIVLFVNDQFLINTATYFIPLMLRYFTFLCLVGLILIHHVLWKIAEDFLS